MKYVLADPEMFSRLKPLNSEAIALVTYSLKILEVQRA